MKTKLFIAASLLFAASVTSAFAYAKWVKYSAVYVNGTWYDCSGASWADGGAFNGKDLGYITSTSLSLAGNSNVQDENNANWNGGSVTMGFKIDGKDYIVNNEAYSLTLDFKGWDGVNNTMQFESGGSTFTPVTIDISYLSAGAHTIEVWFHCDSQWDSNNTQNYKASFYTGPVINLDSNSNENIATLSENKGNPVNVNINNYTLYKDGDWNTLCLPFNLSGEQLGASQLKDVDIWKLNTTSSFDQSGSLVLNFVHQEGSNYKIEAGVPYLVKWNNHGEPIVNPLFKGVTIPNENPGSTDGTNVSFMGTYTFESYTSDNEYRYFVGAGNKLYYVGSGSSTSAFHAYFELESSTLGASGVKAIVLNFGDDTNSIQTISNETSSNEGYFTLDGRRLNDKPATAGLYIINGKKVVIK